MPYLVESSVNFIRAHGAKSQVLIDWSRSPEVLMSPERSSRLEVFQILLEMEKRTNL